MIKAYWGVFENGKPIEKFNNFSFEEQQLNFIDSFIGLLAEWIEPYLPNGQYIAFDIDNKQQTSKEKKGQENEK